MATMMEVIIGNGWQTPENYNVDTMLEVREAIRMDPEHHAQDAWTTDENSTCGTTMCVAGWTAAVCGMTVNQAVGDYNERHGSDHFSIDLWAAEKLGLNNYELHALFFQMDNDRALETLDTMIEMGKNAR